MRKMREDHEDEEMENGELNLVPYLDIVTNVIMFLMMTTAFVAAAAEIPTVAQTLCPACDGKGDADPGLTVHLSDRGFTVAVAGAFLYRDGVAGRLPTLLR